MEGAGCWCSDGQGKPIPNTTTRHGKPKCLKKGKTNIRRSPLRNVNRNKRGCSRADQVQFNTNLIKIFYIDHTRYHQNQQHNQQNVGSSVTDKVVLDWKFSMLDTNRNHLLDKIEYRALKRMVKKVSLLFYSYVDSLILIFICYFRRLNQNDVPEHLANIVILMWTTDYHVKNGQIVYRKTE